MKEILVFCVEQVHDFLMPIICILQLFGSLVIGIPVVIINALFCDDSLRVKRRSDRKMAVLENRSQIFLFHLVGTIGFAISSAVAMYFITEKVSLETWGAFSVVCVIGLLVSVWATFMGAAPPAYLTPQIYANNK